MSVYGSLIITGKEKDLDAAKKFIEADESIHASAILEKPTPFNLYEGAILYSVFMRGASWIDIVAMQQQMAESRIDVEIVLALTDGGGFVDVITTNSDPDIECFENEDAEVMAALAEQYEFAMVDEVDDDSDEYDEDEESEYGDEWEE